MMAGAVVSLLAHCTPVPLQCFQGGKTQKARRAAKKLEETREREARIKKANRALEKRQQNTEEYLQRQRQERMEKDGSSKLAQKFKYERQVRVNRQLTVNKR